MTFIKNVEMQYECGPCMISVPSLLLIAIAVPYIILTFLLNGETYFAEIFG